MFDIGVERLNRLCKGAGLTAEDRTRLARGTAERAEVLSRFRGMVPDLCTLGGNDYYTIDGAYSQAELAAREREGLEAYKERRTKVEIPLDSSGRQEFGKLRLSSVRGTAAYLVYLALTSTGQVDTSRLRVIRVSRAHKCAEAWQGRGPRGSRLSFAIFA